jgi:hypothetical protein
MCSSATKRSGTFSLRDSNPHHSLLNCSALKLKDREVTLVYGTTYRCADFQYANMPIGRSTIKFRKQKAIRVGRRNEDLHLFLIVTSRPYTPDRAKYPVSTAFRKSRQSVSTAVGSQMIHFILPTAQRHNCLLVNNGKKQQVCSLLSQNTAATFLYCYRRSAGNLCPFINALRLTFANHGCPCITTLGPLSKYDPFTTRCFVVVYFLKERCVVYFSGNTSTTFPYTCLVHPLMWPLLFPICNPRCSSLAFTRWVNFRPCTLQ